MGNFIEDGSGGGNSAKVGMDNRLFVDSVQKSRSAQAIIDGYGFNVTTGLITLTSPNQSGVGYFKYTGDYFLIIKEILVILGSSDGSGNGVIEIIKNPTGGTVVSDATPVDTATNRNFNIIRDLAGLAYKGDEGKTLTGGSTFARTSRSDFTQPVAFDADIIVLEKGNSIGVNYTPPSGNTSQTVIIAGTLFEDRFIV